MLLQEATLQDIKKAYRRLSLQLHPDKNDAPDAEVKFRQASPPNLDQEYLLTVFPGNKESTVIVL